jgi:hypothetical protein
MVAIIAQLMSTTSQIMKTFRESVAVINSTYYTNKTILHSNNGADSTNEEIITLDGEFNT